MGRSAFSPARADRVELTNAGRILADYAERVAVLTEGRGACWRRWRACSEAICGLQGASATPGFSVLPEILARFQARYPGVEVTLAISNSADVARHVLDAEFDLGFIGAPAAAPGLQVRPFCGRMRSS